MRLSRTCARSSRSAHATGAARASSSIRLPGRLRRLPPAAGGVARELREIDVRRRSSRGDDARASASRSSTMRARGGRAPPRPSPPAPPAKPPSSRIASSRRRSPVSGVRSWCEAFGDELALRLDVPAERVRHPVERARERLELLRAPPPAPARRARRGRAASTRPRGFGSGVRAGRARSHARTSPARDHGDAERREAEPALAHALRDLAPCSPRRGPRPRPAPGRRPGP